MFYVNNLPTDVVAYEIVRCDRTEKDRTIVSQGVITPIHNYKIVETSDTGEIGRGESNKDTNEYRPMPFLHIPRVVPYSTLHRIDCHALFDAGIHTDDHLFSDFQTFLDLCILI